MLPSPLFKPTIIIVVKVANIVKIPLQQLRVGTIQQIHLKQQPLLPPILNCNNSHHRQRHRQHVKHLSQKAQEELTVLRQHRPPQVVHHLMNVLLVIPPSHQHPPHLDLHIH